MELSPYSLNALQHSDRRRVKENIDQELARNLTSIENGGYWPSNLVTEAKTASDISRSSLAGFHSHEKASLGCRFPLQHCTHPHIDWSFARQGPWPVGTTPSSRPGMVSEANSTR